MIGADEMVSRDFATVSEMLEAHAALKGDARAIVQDGRSLSYRALSALVDRVAAALQRDGIANGEPIAMVSATTVDAVTVFLGAVRAGCVPAPIAPSSTRDQVGTMIADSGARIVFVDDESADCVPAVDAKTVRLDDLGSWLGADDAVPAHVPLDAKSAFNIIYSSGTTGRPKGIVHTHAMRWMQIKAYAAAGLGSAVTMVATPLYSNTTLVSLLPTIAYGGTVVLLRKFDARRFLEIAAAERATHAMLVPVQYQRIMAVADFDAFDLTSFAVKTSTSAPLSAELKADIVKRWPGLLVEIYGMTEGGGTCLLYANMVPDKLHTVGQAAPGTDIRLIDGDGHEVPQGGIGEVVGRSEIMMAGYHKRPEATAALEWVSADGHRFIRHGDIGRFDEDGFLTLLGRSKDMIISGGFNVYPPDIENVLLDHPAIGDVAVIGVPSDAWGETPYAFYVADDPALHPDAVVAWANARVGRTQRLSGAEAIAALPRSAIGKVLKRELRDRLHAPKHITSED